MLLPYGSKKPLDVIGFFEGDIAAHANDTVRRAIFYVIRNGIY